MLVYDETENFRDYYSPLFNYAYEPRKSKISTISLNFNTNNTANYNGAPYYHQETNFMLSQTCLDDDAWESLMIWDAMYKKVKSYFRNTTNLNGAFLCNGGDEPTPKVKYDGLTQMTKKFISEDYGAGFIQN